MYIKMKAKPLCVKDFLELFLSLLQSGYPFTLALRILMQKDETKTYAGKILEAVENQGSVTNAVCSLYKKLNMYKTMLMTAEESGDIVPALSGVIEELKESEEDRRNLMVSAVYPVFVCILALAMSVVLIKYGLSYITLISEVDEKEIIRSVVTAVIFLFACVSIVFSLTLYSCRRFDFPYLFFRNLYYLNKSSVGMEEALRLLLREKYFSEKELKCVSKILSGIREGKPLWLMCDKTGMFDVFTVSWLFIAGESGDVEKGFLKIYESYRNKRIKARESARRSMEPLLLAVCGIYVVILIAGCVIPVFLNLGSKIL